MPCRQTHYKYDREEERDTEREEKKERIKEEEKSSEERIHFKQQSALLSASISLSLSPTAMPTATPAIKSNKARAHFGLDVTCRGNDQSDAQCAATSRDRVNPGLRSLITY